MTPEERAKRWFEFKNDLPICRHCPDDMCKECDVVQLADVIRQAVEETPAVVLPVAKDSILGTELLRRAKAEAYEDAAKIADLFSEEAYTSDTKIEAQNIAEQIRARAKEMK